MSVSSASVSAVESGFAVSSSSSSSSHHPKNTSQVLVDGTVIQSSRSNSTNSGSVVTPKKKPRDLFGRMLVGMEAIGDSSSAFAEDVATADASGGNSSVKGRLVDIKQAVFDTDSDKFSTLMTAIPPPPMLKKPPSDDTTNRPVANNHGADDNNGDTAAGTQAAETAALRSLGQSTPNRYSEQQVKVAKTTAKEQRILGEHGDAYRPNVAYSSLPTPWERNRVLPNAQSVDVHRPQEDGLLCVDSEPRPRQVPTQPENASYPPSRVVVHHRSGNSGTDEDVASSFTQSHTGGDDVNVVAPKKPPPPRLPYVNVGEQSIKSAAHGVTPLPYSRNAVRASYAPADAASDDAEVALSRRSIELYGRKDPPAPTPPHPQPLPSRRSPPRSYPQQQQQPPFNSSSLLSSFLRTTGIGAGDAEAIAAAYVSQTSHASFSSAVTTSPRPPHATPGMSLKVSPSPRSKMSKTHKYDSTPQPLRPPPLSSYSNIPRHTSQEERHPSRRPAPVQQPSEPPATSVAPAPAAPTDRSLPASPAGKDVRIRALSVDVTSVEAEADGPEEEEEEKNAEENHSGSSFKGAVYLRPSKQSEETNFSQGQRSSTTLDAGALPLWELPGEAPGTDEDVAIALARKEFAAAQQEEEEHLRRALSESAKVASSGWSRNSGVGVKQLENEGEGVEAFLSRDDGRIGVKQQTAKGQGGIVIFDESRRTATTAATTAGTPTNGSASDVIGASGVDSGGGRGPRRDDKDSDASSIADELFLALCRKEAQLRTVNFRSKAEEADVAKAKAKSILDDEATTKKLKNEGVEEENGVVVGGRDVPRTSLEIEGPPPLSVAGDGRNRRRRGQASRLRPRFFFRRIRSRNGSTSRTAGATPPVSKSSASAIASIAMSEGLVGGVEDEEFVEIDLDGGHTKLSRHRGGRRPSPNNLPSVIHASEYPSPPHLSSHWKQSYGSQNIDDIDEFMAASASGSSAAVRSIIVPRNPEGDDTLNHAVPVGIGPADRGPKPKSSLSGSCGGGGGQLRVCIVIVATIAMLLAVAAFLIFFDPGDVGDGVERPSGEPEDETRQPNPRPSMSPTLSPAPSVDLSSVQDLFRPYSGTMVDTAGTPQHSAVQWLATYDGQRFPTSADDTVLERYAAVVLYFATTGNNAFHLTTDAQGWLRPENWLSPDLVLCEWHEGLKCERVGGGEFVGTIDLSRTGLSGLLPPEISLFKHLHALILDDNRIGGNIPSKIGELQSLTELQLEQNLLTGTLPGRIGNLKNLITLSLSRNDLSGPLPHGLYELPHLKILDISHNNFSGSLSERIRDVSSLRTLNVDSNGMRGTIPDGIRFLNGLSTVKLDNNRFSGHLPEFKLLVLEEFTCSNNLLSGTLPIVPNERRGLRENSSIFDLTGVELKKVDLSGNRFGGTVNDAFANFLSLKHLDLSENKFTGTLVPTLSTMDSLEHFNASGNDFDGPPPTLSAPRLKYVDLANNKFSGLSLGDATTTLEYLDFSNNNLAGSVPSDLGSLPNLSFASFRNCRLKGEIPVSLRNLISLSSLDLSSNIVNGSLPEELGQLQSIVELRLDDNALSGTVPASFGNMTNLRALYLRRNNIRGPIPSGICELRNLHTLQVDSSVACSCCSSGDM